MEARTYKLGSLFDGSGTCPLAAVMNGIEPVWAAEIEPFPILVTKKNFPDMKHLGDVSKVNGADVEPVDIITFGSPCQDLSVAGRRMGIHEGQRSHLFFEAIRIIDEMRKATNGMYPRFALWENVPGALSSGKPAGADFRAVLQAFADVVDGEAAIAEPERRKGSDGFAWGNAGCVLGNGWSIAWRMLDAQYFGVPQRRKRIFALADFRGERAGEVLFKPDCVPWHPAPCWREREEAAGGAGGGAETADREGG